MEDHRGKRPELSIVIPAHNEEACIASTLDNLSKNLSEAEIDYEIVVVNDHSVDSTKAAVGQRKLSDHRIRLIENDKGGGFGLAVRKGLEVFSGDIVAIYMADASDCPSDLVKSYRLLRSSSCDCVFGSRFVKGSKVSDYPRFKLYLNRLTNNFIRLVFGIKFNDITNAFKLYRREVILGLQPLLSHHFNLTVELPLKAIVRGYSYRTLPISWTNRQAGISKLKLKEMGSRYLFIILYCAIERWLSKGDYHRTSSSMKLQGVHEVKSIG